MKILTVVKDIAKYNRGHGLGVVGVCTSNIDVLRLVASCYSRRERFLLVEATCNQVNQFGGYSKLLPDQFVSSVRKLCIDSGYDPDMVAFGGDHIGPYPWKNKAHNEAMKLAAELARAYARAGFQKIHLDTSISCLDDATPLDPDTVALRAAHLAREVERECDRNGLDPPVYVIGSDVPNPGGATVSASSQDKVTRKQDLIETLSAHREAFTAAGIGDALDRVVAVVVNAGCEFSSNSVEYYKGALAGLSDVLPNDMCFEAHSTDFQDQDAITLLKKHGCGVLKIGPALTFAFRETLYALDLIASFQSNHYQAFTLPKAIQEAMLESPAHWTDYYRSDSSDFLSQLHFSYSDRTRYYFQNPSVIASLSALMAELKDVQLSRPLVSQFFPDLVGSMFETTVSVSWVLQQRISNVLTPYRNNET